MLFNIYEIFINNQNRVQNNNKVDIYCIIYPYSNIINNPQQNQQKYKINKQMNKQREHRRVWTIQVRIRQFQQDQKLKTYVQQSADLSKPKWKQISQSLNNTLYLQFKRNAKQCRQRWYNSLAPTSQQTKQWGVDDDVTLIQACKKYGHRWSRLTKQFNQKVNDNRLKNHFYSTVRKVVRVINNIVKQSKKQYQKNVKNNTIQHYTQQQITTMKQIIKLRAFQPKLLSKVFSLIDQKQEYRYQAKQSLSVEQVKLINDQILDYMQDYVTGQNVFTISRILKMIAKVMYVNRTIKTKYIRQVKLSLQDQLQIHKQQESRKKRQKKINIIVKQELENKIIPDRKTKNEIINKIRDQNKKLKRLIKSVDKRRIKRKKIDNLAPTDQGKLDQNNQIQVQKKQIDVQQADNPFGNQFVSQKVTISGKNDKNTKDQKLNNIINNEQEQNQVNILKKNPFNYDFNINFNKNTNNFNPNTAQPSNFLHNFSFNLNQNINLLNNISFSYEKNQLPSKIQEQQKILKIRQSFSPSNFLVADKNNTFQKIQRKINNKQEPSNKIQNVSSRFLDTIPWASSNPTKKSNNEGGEFKQIVNFPEHKLTHSQGYFTFDPPNIERNDPIGFDLYQSNHILNSLNLIGTQHFPNQQNVQMGSNKVLRDSKLFQGLFAYSSNNDKISEQSERMKSSIVDLIPNYNPMHISAFIPIGNLKQHEIEGARQNKRFMEASRPFSAQFDEIFQTRKFGMEQSQPIQLFRSKDQRNQMNPQGPNLCYSCSFGELSQRSKSNRSKRNK